MQSSVIRFADATSFQKEAFARTCSWCGVPPAGGKAPFERGSRRSRVGIDFGEAEIYEVNPDKGTSRTTRLNLWFCFAHFACGEINPPSRPSGVPPPFKRRLFGACLRVVRRAAFGGQIPVPPAGGKSLLLKGGGTGEARDGGLISPQAKYAKQTQRLSRIIEVNKA